MMILITGATGYIGANLIRNLAEKHELYALVRDSSNTNILLDVNCKILKFKNDDDVLAHFVKYQFEGVIHLASNVCINHQFSDIKKLIESNLLFGTLLLDSCVQTKVTWFINTGSFWQNFLGEPYNPVNLYAATKEAYQDIIKYYTETSDLIVSTLKLNDTFGPNDSRDKIMSLWISLVKEDGVLKMSPGDQIIDISYIEDVVGAYEKLVEHLNSHQVGEFNNKTFVVHNDERVTLKELATIFEEASGTKLNIQWGGRKYREREVMEPFAKGNPVPGWKQNYTLREAIIKTITYNNI